MHMFPFPHTQSNLPIPQFPFLRELRSPYIVSTGITAGSFSIGNVVALAIPGRAAASLASAIAIATIGRVSGFSRSVTGLSQYLYPQVGSLPYGK